MSATRPHIDSQPSTLRFLNDHDEMWEHVDTIKGADDAEVARAALDELQELLPGHLSVEEGASGFFEALVDAEPRLQETLERITRDHERIRAKLVALRGAVGAPDELDQMKAFARFLDVHEARERAALDAARRACASDS